MSSDIDPRLTALATQLLTQAADLMPAEVPTREPIAGQSRDEWLVRVQQIRDAHDAAAKALVGQVTTKGPEVGSVRDHEIAVDGGIITARSYHPPAPGPHRALVFFHGGAWWLGGGEANLELTDDFCRTFCAGLPAVVVNVDYRLAPEHPFPQQLHDSFAGLEWVVAHGDELDIDPSRVCVLGASSGGNQAAAVCLLARERGGPRIAAQVLHVPALDLTAGSPSLREDPGFEGFDTVIGLYADREQRLDGLASPLLAPSLAGLPPAVVVTGEYDPLRDDGRRYAERLQAEGVPVRHLHYPMLHNIALPETTEQMFADVIAALVALD